MENQLLTRWIESKRDRKTKHNILDKLEKMDGTTGFRNNKTVYLELQEKEIVERHGHLYLEGTWHKKERE